ncbi:Golgi_apparatus membrane protein TVP23 homolog [Hexamita inflata]|uniref:Golgi apparatus membrane protein TVP23 homolog n=1 Tax=Hexamita inflata TaxID=28002 RepID=A0ABP1GER1_9EUKA
MADFDPYATTSAPIQAAPSVATKQTSAVEPRKGNKLTRNTSHWLAMIIYCLFTFYPIIYGIVSIFAKPGLVANYIAFAVGIGLGFYNTKNFAGRYLGKLRWHTYTVEGKTYYYFESMSKEGQSKLDNVVFWTGLWFTPVYFIVISIAYILTLQATSIPITIVGSIAGFVNLSAYIRCSNDYKKKLKGMASDIGKQYAQQQFQEL